MANVNRDELRQAGRQLGVSAELLDAIVQDGYDSLEVLWEAFEDPNNLAAYARDLFLVRAPHDFGVTDANFAFAPAVAKLKALRRAAKNKVEPQAEPIKWNHGWNQQSGTISGTKKVEPPAEPTK